MTRGLALLGAAALAVVAALSLPAVLAASPVAPPARAEEDGDPAAGRERYLEGCASCHGSDGRGVEDRGPSLEDAGAASASFYLTTGRMPLDQPGKQPIRKPPAYPQDVIDDLVAYVATLGDGPPIPSVRPEDGSLSEGQQLYTANCAACHSSAGAGGAVGRNAFAPGITRATPQETAEAIRIGPGAMPAFGPATIDDDQLDDIVRYTEYLDHPEDRGGAPLGRIGPVPEGLVAWVVGLGSLVLVMHWIGDRR
ncbi:cytochrome bc1 complex diheme cytochrome c subunit [Dermatobacter hominis]|uniref:cytochrome bc1 complex diheme cytochrome c subunit n=1 Tax=Dermatobacter hominis TaxID=2884263 RepID=UPI001D0F8DA6|nr:c-type cytochrome [Dermatobacter hominis]UDY34159.1 c-type cytochrome [Dermatobacter hominis]